MTLKKNITEKILVLIYKKELSEQDYKDLILDHYTFLKRPVIIYNDKIFIGNSKKTVAAAKAAIHG